MLHGNQRSRGRYDLQQHLSFTVLKLCPWNGNHRYVFFVATAPTVYGIIRKIKYSKNYKNHGICRGFLFPSFSDYFVRAKPHIM